MVYMISENKFENVVILWMVSNVADIRIPAMI